MACLGRCRPCSCQSKTTLRFDPYLRINCGWPHQQDVEQGLRRLGQIVTELVAMGAPR